ncbi:hypothetical protein J437_LFUL017742 [Ladona fulva]|uniref:SUI1 domain-containing protein n=1 Tax=Ladona fulva TaxID=123851 RepID=A0A8K0KPI1_LADFU|nr:hypothetical protein J437_LFUL017742 [Ladona fulva]
MFKKPYRVKTNTQVKASERKRIRLEIGSHFPQLTEDDLASLIPNKETISVLKIAAHSGENVMVYLAEKTPVAFVINKVMYPTVYMLWKFPTLVHSYTTYPVVFSKLVGGADLMLPGVVVEEPFTIKSFGKVEKGDVVAVNLTDNFAPVAVGTAALSSFDMYMSAKRGKCVHIVHFYGDQLCTNVKLSPPSIPHPSVIGIDEGVAVLEECDSIVTSKQGKSSEGNGCPNAPDAGKLANLKLEEKGVSDENAAEVSESREVEYESLAFCKLELGDDAVDRVEKEVDYITEDANMTSESENEDEESIKEIIEIESEMQENVTEEGECGLAQESSKTNDSENISEEASVPSNQEVMDKLLEYSFLKALKTTARKLNLPVLTSNFYKVHMIPSCPKGELLDLKKSSYKKLSKFLKEMEEKGVIEVRELTKGVESITNINFSNPLLKHFVEDSDDDDECNEAIGTKKPAEINEMKGDSLLGTMIRQHLTDYVTQHALQSASDKSFCLSILYVKCKLFSRFVKLDHLLSSCLRVKEDELAWKELFVTCIEQMGHSFSVGQTGQITKGKLKPIEIIVATRTGNKKVTLINNLESYGINCSEFAKKCQHGVAASATVTQLPGTKAAQVMVQGNQVIFLEKLLTGR